MMHSELIELEDGRTATTHSESDDVQGYAAAAGLVHCVTAGMLLGWGAYELWFRGDSLTGVIEQAIQDMR